VAWSPGRSIFRSFFASIFDSILDSSWVRFGVVSGAFWDPFGGPNRVKLGQKCVLNHIFFLKIMIFTRIYVFQGLGPFLTPRWVPRSPQDRSKTGPRATKSDAFFVLIFVSFWGRLGVVFGPIWGAKIDPKTLPTIDPERPFFDLVIGGSQDGRQDRPKRVQEPPRAAQDPPKTLPRGPKTAQERPETPPKQSKEGPRAPKSGLRNLQLVVLGSFWVWIR
jgi:hypothetical protein